MPTKLVALPISRYAVLNYIGFRLMVEMSVYLPKDVDILRYLWYSKLTGMYRPNIDRWRTCLHSIDRLCPLYLLYIYSEHLNQTNFKEIVVSSRSVVCEADVLAFAPTKLYSRRRPIKCALYAGVGRWVAMPGN